MTELWPFIDAALKYLVLPGAVWIYSLHKNQMALQTEVAVLKAEAITRNDAVAKQLDQILTSINTLSGRIDAMMKDR